MMRLTPFAGLLLLAACAPDPPPPYYPTTVVSAPPQPAPFWQGEGWTVSRIAVPGPTPGQYCIAKRDGPGPDFALTETPTGLVGWNVSDTTGHATPRTAYPMELRFGVLGVLPYMAYMQGPGRLSGAAPKPDIAARFVRNVTAAPAVDISSPVLGTLGGFQLGGSAAMLPQLDVCARTPAAPETPAEPEAATAPPPA